MATRICVCAAVLAAAVLSGQAVGQEKWGSPADKLNLAPTIYTPRNAPPAPKIENLPRTKSVSQYGITWTFDKEVPVGRFITGDYYVVGPVTVVAIDPKPLFGKEVIDAGWQLINKGAMKEDAFKDTWCRNGSTLNEPTPGAKQGYDSRMPHGEFDPAEVARVPIAMKPGDALVSSISSSTERVAETEFSGHSRVLKSMAVLTCIAEPQPADAFRPSYGDRKQKIYLARNLHRELLYSLPRPKSAPKLEDWVRRTHRPWIDVDQWNHASAEENQPRYGQWYTWTTSNVSLMLHLDFKPEEKEALLLPFVQRGIDLWGVIGGGFPGWQGHGGFSGGRKWQIIFTGMLLGDTEMRSPSTKYPECLFGEDTQTSDGRSFWGHDVVFTSHPVRIKGGSWEVSPDTQPSEDWTNLSNEGYRRCCTSVVWPGQALAARMMRAETFWNHDPFFRYVDRWMTEDHAAEFARMAQGLRKNTHLDQKLLDTYATRYETSAKQYKSGGYRLTEPFQLEMWTKYRKNLPPARAGSGPVNGTK